MNFLIEENEEYKTLSISGEINTKTAGELDAYINDNISASDQIQIDFGEVSLITSSGVRVLMKLDKTLKRRGKMVFVNVPESVYQIFKLTGLDKVFSIDRTADEAEISVDTEDKATDDISIAKKAENSSVVLRYTVEQITNSKLYSKIDKLRTMFDKVHFVNELDTVQKVGMEVNYNIKTDDLDPVFARIFVSNNEVIGILDAKERNEGEIWINDILVSQKKEAESAIVLMFASMFDASYLMLMPDSYINIIIKKLEMVKAFKTIIGEPSEIVEDYSYRLEV